MLLQGISNSSGAMDRSILWVAVFCVADVIAPTLLLRLLSGCLLMCVCVCVWSPLLLSNYGATDNTPEQKHGFSVSCRYLTPNPERLWKVTWILMAHQHYPWELLREFLDYLSKQLLPNFLPFAARRELSNTSSFPLPHSLFKSVSISLLWFFFPTSVSRNATQIS